MSLIITRAPSSTARFATAKPIPVPAAAVTSTLFPTNKFRPTGYEGGGTGMTTNPFPTRCRAGEQDARTFGGSASREIKRSRRHPTQFQAA